MSDPPLERLYETKAPVNLLTYGHRVEYCSCIKVRAPDWYMQLSIVDPRRNLSQSAPKYNIDNPNPF